MQEQTFYAMFAETKDLFFFLCAAQEEFIEGYGALLEHLYQIKRDAFEQVGFYHIFAGNREYMTDTFNKGNGIVENRLERLAYIHSEMDKIFTLQSQAPFVYIDGYEQNVQKHFELTKQVVTNFGSKASVTSV